MSHTHEFSNREIDATFRGEAIDPDLAPVANWADALRQAANVEIDDLMATAHLTAAAAAITEAAPVGQSESAAPTPRARRRFVLSTFLSTLVGKILAGGVALATVTGGVAATGALPDAVQDPIAGVYAIVGFDFPSSDDDVDDSDIADVDDADIEDIDDADIEDIDDADIEDIDDADIEDIDDADIEDIDIEDLEGDDEGEYADSDDDSDEAEDTDSDSDDDGDDADTEVADTDSDDDSDEAEDTDVADSEDGDDADTEVADSKDGEDGDDADTEVADTEDGDQ